MDDEPEEPDEPGNSIHAVMTIRVRCNLKTTYYRRL